MSPAGKSKILIADDDIAIIKDIISVLTKNPDYIILTTGNGKSACEIANVEFPDLIIMDWQMPVMDGIDAIQQLQQNEFTKDIPVIISTGVMIDSIHLSRALIAGAVDYLRKPIDGPELTARVANMLSISQAYTRIKQQNIKLQSLLTTKLIDIQHLNELKFAVIKQLTIIKELSSDPKNQRITEAILNTESLLKSKTYQIDWANFESNFEFVHKGFFNKLKSVYGNFTPNELRLIAFIKLNMTSKEIASIIYTSPDSVDTARKRLKKKLGLLSHESLQTFIHYI